MEAYKYPLISQPNSVHYATCLGLVEYYLSVWIFIHSREEKWTIQLC